MAVTEGNERKSYSCMIIPLNVLTAGGGMSRFPVFLFILWGIVLIMKKKNASDRLLTIPGKVLTGRLPTVISRKKSQTHTTGAGSL